MARPNITADPRLDLHTRIWASIDAGFGDMFDAMSWRFANLFTLSERISPPAPLGSCGSSSRRSTGCVKLQVNEQRPVSMYPAAPSI
jgi:hypothetical protein